MLSTAADIALKLSAYNSERSNQRLSDEYPWYVFAHLADALQQQDADAISRAAAFVHQPLQLHALLFEPKQVDVAFAEGVLAIDSQQATTAVLSPAEALASPADSGEGATLNERADWEASAAEAVESASATMAEQLSEETSFEPLVDAEPVEEVLVSSAGLTSNGADEGDDHSTSHPLKEQAAERQAEETTEQPKEQHAFLPYHTVDYFAALGIKIDPQLLVTTRLDTQMKSFTQWLKSMKRINYEAALHSEPDKDIQEKALRSLQNNPVLTETMVEVLVKQNKTQQAVELLEKLAGLHPEKSSLFAARIEALKQQL